MAMEKNEAIVFKFPQIVCNIKIKLQSYFKRSI